MSCSALHSSSSTSCTARCSRSPRAAIRISWGRSCGRRPPAFIGCALILAAGFVDGGLKYVLWVAALAVGFLGPLFTDLTGWRVEPAHFIERHGLIMIIAIGESLIAIGFAATNTGLDTGVIVAAVLGLVVATSFWLAYFDFFPFRARQLLADRSGAERTALARDIYTYLHLPMVAGIVLFAFAMETTLAHVHDELDTIPALGLCVGPAVYLFSFVALRFRVSRTLGRGRLVAAVACALLWPSPSSCRRSSRWRSWRPSGSCSTRTRSSGGATPVPRRARTARSRDPMLSAMLQWVRQLFAVGHVAESAGAASGAGRRPGTRHPWSERHPATLDARNGRLGRGPRHSW